MLSSAKHQRNLRVSATNKNKTLNKVSSISPSSPSSSSSSSTSSSSPLPSQDSQTQKRSLITMEEVWKDINLASIHHINHHSQHPQHNHEPRFRSHNHQNQNPNSIFQDFLNGPLNEEPAPTSLAMGSASNGDSTTVTALCSSPFPPPATVLSLNSGAGFEFLDNQDPLVVTPNSNLQSHHNLSNIPSFNTPFEALVTSTCFGKKRGQESNEGTGNRRHKRMIKNRESAARSRARKQECVSLFLLSTQGYQREEKKCTYAIKMLLMKPFVSHLQAYTNELELEVAHLQAENARLKRQQDQLRMAAANPQPKKNTLQRSFTAPF
ncbi:PREDICTED: protein FD-like isoform X1 [Camelina sativa]|uniref:Protein FD-like isoform X1 n=1 Tax=Camelina sativa TaxID=90675 RepID=A0ABM0U883_CAMSA|nr:PREDICTED: protein FD-like isoform X1 [Camelina sativa]